MAVNPGFWRNRRVFLTGHTGFKGSWLSLWLQQLGAQVTGYALAPPTTPNLFELGDVAHGMQSLLGDVCDRGALERAVQQAQPEIVIHMAAQALVRPSYDNPVATYATNVMGTVHLLEALRSTSCVRAFVNVTSDKCYDNKERNSGYREGEALGGYDPYSSSKACAELITSAYRNSFFSGAASDTPCPAIASARAGNVIGGGDWAKDRLVPDIVAAFELGQTVEIRNPHAVRPWQHVLEPLRGYLTLAEKLTQDGPRYASAWNFGPEDQDAWPVERIVQRMADKWGAGAAWCKAAGNHPHEASYLKLDISKARELLEWRPLLSLEQALDMTVEWAQDRRRGADMRACTERQIIRYQQMSAQAAG